MTTTHHVALYAGEIIGEATTEAEAIALASPGGKPGCVADDGPRIQGYSPDGKGVWIVSPADVWDEFFRLAAESDRPMTGLDGDMMPIYATRDTRNAS